MEKEEEVFLFYAFAFAPLHPQLAAELVGPLRLSFRQFHQVLASASSLCFPSATPNAAGASSHHLLPFSHTKAARPDLMPFSHSKSRKHQFLAFSATKLAYVSFASLRPLKVFFSLVFRACCESTSAVAVLLLALTQTGSVSFERGSTHLLLQAHPCPGSSATFSNPG